MNVNDPPELLSLATLNLRLHLDDWEARAPLVFEQLARWRPHLLALQEVWIPIQQAQRVAEALNARLVPEGLAPYTVHERPKWGFGGGDESCGVLSRLPVVASDGVDLPGGRIAAGVVVEWGGRLVELVSTHLHFGPPDTADGIRRSQIRGIEAWLEARRDVARTTGAPYVLSVVAGDFNAPPESEAVTLMAASWRSAYREVHGREPESTYGTPVADRHHLKMGYPLFRGTLDYVFLPEGVTPRSARVICDEPSADDPELYPSDHFGLLVEVDVAAGR